MKPDGYLRIQENVGKDMAFEHTFFTEIDRSTEPQKILAQRAACYLDYYRRGGLAIRHGKATDDFKDYPYRVLMIFQNPERRNNAAERLLTICPPILTQCWLSTFADVIANPLDPIWVRPADYQSATAGTAYEVNSHRHIEVYRRQTEREALVERNVRKQSLIVLKT